MSNVNLATEKIPQSKLKSVGIGLVTAILGLILVSCLYIILLFMNKKVSAQIEATHSQYKSEYTKFLASDANDVLDFKKRNDLAQKLIAQNKSTEDIFNQLEKYMLPRVYLTSYDYDATKGEITLECEGDSFREVAKQTASFKEGNYFKKVSLGKSAMDINSNRVSFVINLKIK